MNMHRIQLNIPLDPYVIIYEIMIFGGIDMYVYMWVCVHVYMHINFYGGSKINDYKIVKLVHSC